MSNFKKRALFLILCLVAVSVIGVTVYINREWFSKTFYTPLPPNQKAANKVDKKELPQKEESIDSLDERFFYKFLRMENKRVYIDDSLVLEIIKQTVKKIKNKDQSILFAYENEGNVLKILLSLKKDNEVIQKRYTFRVKQNYA